ncbi:MAG TPA: histidine kinase, partial [Caulobacter sp.]|nr:histidine kinase [Caulobacter sp.]
SPARPAGTPPPADVQAKAARNAHQKDAADREVAAEVERALAGEPQATVRRNESGDRVVSVSIPIRHVRQVLGVMTLEAGNVDEILGAQRRALVPFALVALAVN